MRIHMLFRKWRLPAILVIIAGIVLAGSVCAQNTRQNYRPVTLTQDGWRLNAASVMYSRWNIAFNNFCFYGYTRRNWLYVGGKWRIGIEGTGSGLARLARFFPQTGPSRSLVMNHECPAGPTEAGALAGEVVALTMNVTYNDTRVMPRSPGYDLELFRISRGILRGRTVGQALDIANRVLGGDPPVRYGFPNHEAVTEVVRSINANYEFTNYGTFNDRGYLVPNRPFGLSDPPHDPRVPS